MGSIAIKKQGFGEMLQIPFGYGADGVMGLGFESISINNITPPFYNMIAQHSLDEPIFSLRLGLSEQDGGEVTFGGLDSSAYSGQIRYYPLLGSALWEIPLYRVVFGEVTIEFDNAGAAFDTGSSVISMPSDLAYRFNKECVESCLASRSCVAEANAAWVASGLPLDIGRLIVQISTICQTYPSLSAAIHSTFLGRITSSKQGVNVYRL